MRNDPLPLEAGSRRRRWRRTLVYIASASVLLGVLSGVAADAYLPLLPGEPAEYHVRIRDGEGRLLYSSYPEDANLTPSAEAAPESPHPESPGPRYLPSHNLTSFERLTRELLQGRRPGETVHATISGSNLGNVIPHQVNATIGVFNLRSEANRTSLEKLVGPLHPGDQFLVHGLANVTVHRVNDTRVYYEYGLEKSQHLRVRAVPELQWQVHMEEGERFSLNLVADFAKRFTVPESCNFAFVHFPPGHYRLTGVEDGVVTFDYAELLFNDANLTFQLLAESQLHVETTLVDVLHLQGVGNRLFN